MSKRPAVWLPILARLWPMTWNGARLVARLRPVPILGKLAERLSLPMFTGKNLNVSYIPIGEIVDGAGGNSVLTREIVAELIRRSSHRVIIGTCTCRDAKRCENHPIDYGCIQLGEGTKQIDPRIARHVSVQECLDYLEKAVADGLTPMVGRVRIDDLLWGVKNEGRMMAVCLCCRCCCTIMNSCKYWPPEAAGSLHRLKGLAIVNDAQACTGCGACREGCFMEAISPAPEGGMIIDNERCKGCGYCVNVCEHKAMKAVCDDVDAAVREFVDRVGTLISIT